MGTLIGHTETEHGGFLIYPVVMRAENPSWNIGRVTFLILILLQPGLHD